MSTTKTLEQFQNVYSTIEEWYADLTGARKSWVDDNWKSMMEHFVEYADQSLKETVEDVDDRDAPNVFPYKECSECGERKSCGAYHENDWLCEDCGDEEEEEKSESEKEEEDKSESEEEEEHTDPKPDPCGTCGRVPVWYARWERWSVMDGLCQACETDLEHAQ